MRIDDLYGQRGSLQNISGAFYESRRGHDEVRVQARSYEDDGCRRRRVRKRREKDDGVDICKVTGTCKSTMAEGAKTVMESSDCAALKTMLLSDTSADDKKCMDAMVA